jgi:hypothetical protein
MNNQPAFDRSILIPIFLSILSVVGIVVVLLVGRALNSPAEVPVTPSATRFQYVYLGTEPVLTTPIVEETEIEPPAPTEAPIEEPGGFTPIVTTQTSPAVSTPILLVTPTPNPQQTNTPPPSATSASGPPMNPGTYDDVDSHLIYNGWTATNSGGTLHVSIIPGSTITFRFIGSQLRLVYQGGNTLGQVRITIDNVSKNLDQTNTENQWASDTFASGVHNVLITHVGGGSVNLDQIIIPETANTPTPTRTPTLGP